MMPMSILAKPSIAARTGTSVVITPLPINTPKTDRSSATIDSQRVRMPHRVVGWRGATSP